jgi:hypothetical protein
MEAPHLIPAGVEYLLDIVFMYVSIHMYVSYIHTYINTYIPRSEAHVCIIHTYIHKNIHTALRSNWNKSSFSTPHAMLSFQP